MTTKHPLQSWDEEHPPKGQTKRDTLRVTVSRQHYFDALRIFKTLPTEEGAVSSAMLSGCPVEVVIDLFVTDPDYWKLEIIKELDLKTDDN